MANPARVPGLRGYRPTPVPVLARSPVFENYLTGPPITPPAATVDWYTRVTDWPMYLNDQIGDCTVAAPGHFFAGMSVYAGFPFPLFSDQVITSTYSAVSGYVEGNPATDRGADPGTVCEFLRTAGMTDEAGKTHKLAAYARLAEPGNWATLKAALDLTGTVYVAITCPDSALSQFQAGRPWTWVPGSPSDGGHAICLQREAENELDMFTFITWGAGQRANRAFVRNTTVEAWAVFSEDWVQANGLSPSGFSAQQLVADLPSL